MNDESPTVRVHVNIELPAACLQAVVAYAKKKTIADEQGRYRVDTADLLSDLISRFLAEKDFEAYAKKETHYPVLK